MTGRPYIAEAVGRVRTLHADLIDGDARRRPVRERLDAMARRLVEAHGRGDPAVAVQLSNWAPERIGDDAAAILAAPLSLEEARTAIAREHGWDDWTDVEREGAAPPDADFESAVEDVIFGRLATLRAMLRRRPELVRARSALGHGATLLHYVAANGVETYRQVVPRNAAAVAQTLLDAGADPTATMRVYDCDCMTHALLATSAHPAKAGVEPAVAAVLRAAGATSRRRRRRTFPRWVSFFGRYRRAQIERLPEAKMFPTPQERAEAVDAAQRYAERGVALNILSPIVWIAAIVAMRVALRIIAPGLAWPGMIIAVVLGTVLAEAVIWTIVPRRAVRELRRRLAVAGVAVCRECGYDLREHKVPAIPRCPECGTVLRRSAADS